MAAIKGLTISGDKWKNRAAGASQDYAAGVGSPRVGWQTAALKAEGNYKSGVTAAANAGRYGAGVRSSGDSVWQSKTLQKGPGRYVEGVSVGQSDWEKGFSPYHQAISSLTLPDRSVRGSPANLNRVAAVATTLRSVFERKGGKA